MDRDEATRRRVDTMKAYGLLDTPADPALDAIVRAAADQTDAPIAMIALIDDRRQWFKSKLGVDHSEDPIQFSICAHAIQQDGTFTVPDASKDGRFSQFPAVQKDGGIRFYAGVPLRLSNGVAIGTLCVIDDKSRESLTEEERQGVEALGRRVVAAFELERALDVGDAAAAPAGATSFWLGQAMGYLDRAAVALEKTRATAVLAHLEQAIAVLDARLAQDDGRDEAPALETGSDEAEAAEHEADLPSC